MQQGISLRRETRHRFLKGSGKEQPAGRKKGYDETGKIDYQRVGTL